MASSPALMRIGELSRRSQVSVKTIRYYENLGLLQAVERTAGGFRLFHETSCQRLGFIRQAKALGLSLQDIHHILSLYDQGQSPCADVRRTLQQKIAAIDNQITALQSLKAQLVAQLSVDEAPGTQPGTATICPIIEAGGDPPI